MNLTIYAAGTDENNVGQWSFLIINNDNEHQKKHLQGTMPKASRNRMELVAVANAISVVKIPSTITILSNSQFLVNAFSRGWVRNWKNNNWIRGSTKKAFNTDVLEYILQAQQKHSICFRWLQGLNTKDIESLTK